ncbi:MAG: GntR family transcriptional regulator, partial [Fimbriimonadaceae bacterium]|nr:GntR family transcriptional regulator [Fimbriimonadaceae bacterium]
GSVARWKEIHDSLERRITSGEIPARTTLPSEVDLAAEWGVSRLTAHRALYELARTGLVERKRKLGTVVLGPSERTIHRRVIGGLFFDASDYFQGSYLTSLRRAMTDENHLLYMDTARDTEQEAAALKRMSKEADGIFLFATCAPANNALISRLVKSDFPVICIDRYPESLICDAVGTDNARTARDGVQALIRRGHRRIAHFTDLEMTVASVRDRCRGWREIMDESGLADPTLLRTFPYLGPRDEDEYGQMVQLAEDALQSMLYRGDPPTAVFCLRDHWVSAAYDAAQRIGLRVPDDLEIMGFVDRPHWLLRIPDSIWVLRQDVVGVSQKAAERLEERLDGRAGGVQRLLLPGQVLAPGSGFFGQAGTAVSS